METIDRNRQGIVIESYDWGENQVIVIQDKEVKDYHFFFLSKVPPVDFGATILMDFETERFLVHYGNPHLTFRIFPLVFPNTLLLELITERMNL